MEGSLGGHAADQVDGLGVDVGLILIGIVLLSNADASQRRTLLTEICHDLTGVDAGDGWDTLTSAPFGKRLDSSPVAVLQSVVLDDDSRRLNVRRLKISEQAMLIAGSGGDAVVANQWLGEDEDLSAVGGVGHGLWVANEGGGEDCFAGDVGLRAEGLAGEDRAIL